jgi:hypothetical protein
VRQGQNPPRRHTRKGMVQTGQIPGNIDSCLYSVWQPHPLGMRMITLLLRLRHPQAALEAATPD